MPAGPHQIKFKPEVVDDILLKISKHIPYKKACLSNGVSEVLFYQWLKKGEEDLLHGVQSEHSDVVKRLNDIEAKRIQHHLDNVQDSENGHKGAQWVLERVFWKYFSPKVAEIELNERVEKLESMKGDITNANNAEEKTNDNA